MSTSNFDYVKNYYGVPAAMGVSVIVSGRSGVIVADRGHYIGVNFDSDKPGHISNCHPADNVIYGEVRPIRKMTASQRRYQKYLDVCDCYENFKHFLVTGAKSSAP